MINDAFGESERASKLLRELDARYRQFSEALPRPLNEMALQRASYVSANGDETFPSLASMNPLIACSPWLFWDLFEELSDEDLLAIAESGSYLALASGVMDKLVDGQAESPEHFALLQQVLFERASSGFREVFDSESRFWRQFDRLSKLYWSSLLSEAECQSQPERMTFDVFTDLTGGKVSPIFAILAALSIRIDREELLAPLERSLRSTFIAGQVHDDILDWRLDLEARHVTYFLTRLSESEGLSAKNWPSLEKLESLNHAGWVDVRSFDLAIDWYGKAKKDVDGIPCPVWTGYLDEYRDEAISHQKMAAAIHIKDIIMTGEPA